MLAVAVLLVVQVGSVAEVANPRPDGWVTDQANVVSADAEAQLDAIVDELYRSKGVELAVVTVDRVPGTPKQFATALFDHWKIGNQDTNTGVLVLLVMSQRRLEIETGDGAEGALPSAWLADMQAAHMVPRFKQKDFGGGLVAGVQAMADHLHGAAGESPSFQPPHEYRDDGAVVTSTTPDHTIPIAPPITPPQPAAYVEPDDDDDDDDGPPIGLLVAGGLGAVGAGGGAVLFVRRRKQQRTCEACQPARAMLALDDIEDDKHLAQGQVAEEQVGSVDYEVLVCAGCQTSRTLRHAKWFSGYKRCSSCSYKTMQSSSSTIVHATYDHGGQVEVTESCVGCNHVNTYIRYTSARTRPSTSTSSFGSSSRSSFSSSRSSGGGFGGGRSSGGGAGSSW